MTDGEQPATADHPWYRVLVVCLRDEHVVHVFDGDRLVVAGPVVRTAARRSAAEVLGDVVTSIEGARSDLGGGNDRSLEVVLAIDGERDPEEGLVIGSSVWEDETVRPATYLETALGDIGVRLVDAELVVAAGALAVPDVGGADVGAVLQIGYRMSLHLAVGDRLRVTPSTSSVINLLNHRPLPGNARPCSCGRVGCLATVFGSNSLVDRYLAEGGERPLTYGRGVVEAAGAGDAVAQQIVDEAASWLALAIEPFLDLLAVRFLVVTGPGTAEPVGRAAFGELGARLPDRFAALPIHVVPLQQAAAMFRSPALEAVLTF